MIDLTLKEIFATLVALSILVLFFPGWLLRGRKKKGGQRRTNHTGWRAPWARQTLIAKEDLRGLQNVTVSMRGKLGSDLIAAFFILLFTAPPLTLLGMMLGSLFGRVGAGFGMVAGFLIGFAFYTTYGLLVIPKGSIAVVERLGMFDDVLHSGLHLRCLVGLIDKIILQEDLEYRETPLFERLEPDQNGVIRRVRQAFEFQQGAIATPIITAWMAFIDPGLKTKNDVLSMDLQAVQAAYAFSEQGGPRARAQGVLEAMLRGLFEPATYDQARANASQFCKDAAADEDVRKELGQACFYLREREGLVLHGFDLSTEMQWALQRAYEGAVAAARTKAQSDGVKEAIKTLVQNLKVPVADAIKLWSDIETRATLERMQPGSIHFVAGNTSVLLNAVTPPPGGGVGGSPP